MPRNKFGGKKHKRAKNKDPERNRNTGAIRAGSGQTYAKVLKGLGDRGISVECDDGKKRRAVIPGKFRKRVWIRRDDVILVDLDAFGKDDECLIIHKYNKSEIQDLKSQEVVKFLGTMELAEENNYDELNNVPKQRTVYQLPSSSEEEEEDEFYDEEDSIGSDEEIDIDNL